MQNPFNPFLKMEMLLKQTHKITKSNFYRKLKPSLNKRAFFINKAITEIKIELFEKSLLQFLFKYAILPSHEFFPVLQPGKQKKMQF